MNEKEKEAIELIKYIKEHNSLIGFKNTERRDLAETVLNLIEKQQAEIEKKDKIIDYMAEEIASYNHYEALGKLEDKDCVKQYFNQKIEKGE